MSLTFLVPALRSCMRSSCVIKRICLDRRQGQFRTFSTSLPAFWENKGKSLDYTDSSSHPSKMNLANTVGDMSPNDEGYTLTNIIGLSTAAALVLVMGYAIFFSTYDLELEEKLCATVPGYRDEMSKTPGYVEKIEQLQEQRSNTNLTKKS